VKKSLWLPTKPRKDGPRIEELRCTRINNNCTPA
jgi:hypothetical protein